MNDQHVHYWLLEADPVELRNPPKHIAQHIDTCLTCRAALQRIRTGYADLDNGLDQLSRRKRRKPWRWLPLPLAAAAVVALLLTHHEPTPLPDVTMLAKLMLREPPAVTPPIGKQAVVINRPDATVVWLTEDL